MSAEKLNQKQEAFCVAFAENGGNGTQAYIDAYHPKTENTAAACASKLLRNAKILRRIRQLQDEVAQARLMSVIQIKGTLSDIVRNKGEMTSDRIAASNLLLRAAGVFIRAKVDEDSSYTVVEATRDTASKWGDIVYYDPAVGPPESTDDGGTVIFLPIKDCLEDHEPDDTDNEREIGG